MRCSLGKTLTVQDAADLGIVPVVFGNGGGAEHADVRARVDVRPKVSQRTGLRAGVDNSLNDAEQADGGARQTVNSCDRRHIAGG